VGWQWHVLFLLAVSDFWNPMRPAVLRATPHCIGLDFESLRTELLHSACQGHVCRR